MRWAVVVLVVGGCVSTDAVQCGDGSLCPGGTTCVALAAGNLCATPDQISACVGKAEMDTCTLAGTTAAYCSGGACIENVCGNSRIDPGELCDDGNVAAGDGCSADCKSNETCGNGVIDPIDHETCDDGNLLDHDGCSSTCQLESAAWVRHTMHPPARWIGAAAYDPTRGRVVVFGGRGVFDPVSETWEWNGRDWSRPAGIEPPPRDDAAMAFDGKGIVLYGGGTSADTWTFDGVTWTPIAVTGPGARAGHALAYDSHRKRVVLFGGAMSDDTYEWDGSSWNVVVTVHAPSARSGALMAYDPARGVVVLAGGFDAKGTGSVFTDTWTFDGTDWHDMQVASPPLRNATFAFDTGSQHVIAYGGSDQSAMRKDETWAWTGSAWLDLGNTGAPPARESAQLASTGDTLVLFGGGDGNIIYGDTWLYSAGAWTAAPWPGPRSREALATDAAHGTIVMMGGIDGSGANTTETWTMSRTGWTMHAVPPPTTHLDNVLAFDPIARVVLSFGGYSGSPTNDTYSWDGSAWKLLSSATSPSPRFGSVLAFDGHELAVFGGIAPGNLSNDTWLWKQTTWQQAAPTTSPMFGGPFGLCGAYDAVRDRFTLFGDTNETWTFDGSQWTQLAPATTPPAGGTLTWNPARQRATLISPSALDVWEWDGTTWAVTSTEVAPAFATYNVVTAIDGGGLFLYGANLNMMQQPVNEDAWELRWTGPGRDERCDGSDLDGDHLDRCADPDCWTFCTPYCMPGAACDASAPHCGDGTCDAAHEDCHTCPADCTCTPVCGDFTCDPGETCVGDCP